MLKIAIFDDEELIVNYVEKKIKEIISKNIKIYTYTKLELLRNDYKSGKLQELDVLYIDIKIGNINGITVAEKLQRNNPKLKIVYMTAYSEYSEEIFRTKPTYLLLKPIKKENLLISLEKVKEEQNITSQIKTFRAKGKIFNVKLDSIKYIESNKRIIIIYEKDIKRKIYAKLNEFQKILPKQFFRCHQSYIVNLEQVRELNTNEFILHTGETVPVSQTKYKETKDYFIKYLGDNI